MDKLEINQVRTSWLTSLLIRTLRQCKIHISSWYIGYCRGLVERRFWVGGSQTTMGPPDLIPHHNNMF